MLDQPEKILRVSLTRKQIEESPSIESHKPISRQYEETYHDYYGGQAIGMQRNQRSRRACQLKLPILTCGAPRRSAVINCEAAMASLGTSVISWLPYNCLMLRNRIWKFTAVRPSPGQALERQVIEDC